MTDGPDRPPLAGVRVIDVGTRISAPFCAGLLGDLGADVIKVEDPRGGDFMRTIGPFAPTGDDGPGYGDPLLLPPGKLAGDVEHPVAQAHVLEGLDGAPVALRRRDPPVD